jgi:2TM domain-containing protein
MAEDKLMKRLLGDLGFQIHFGVYLAVNLLLAVINLLTDPSYLWFLWPLAGWGLGVIAHGAAIVYAGRSRLRRIAS